MKSNDTEEQSHTPAPIGLRITAGIIDCVVVAAIIFGILTNFGDALYVALGDLSDMVYPALSNLIDLSSKPNSLAHIILCSILLFILYHAIPLWLIQQSLGKALLGLQVTRLGKKPGFFWALGRPSIGYLFVDLFGIGLFVALFERQTFHDYVFGSTVTIRESGYLNIRSFHARFKRYKKKLDAAGNKNEVIGAVLKYREIYKKLLWYKEKLKGYWLSFQSLIGPSVVAGTAATAISSAVIVTAMNVPVINKSLTESNLKVEPVVSKFKEDTNGWTVSEGGELEKKHTPEQISAQNKVKGESWWWQAPVAFRGEKGDYYNRHLRFKLKSVENGGFFEKKISNPIGSTFSNSLKGQDIVLKSKGGVTLVYDIPDHPDDNWKKYCVPLDGSGKWRIGETEKEVTEVDMKEVLKDLHHLKIRGKYEFGSNTGSLKEVIFGDPEPCEEE